MAQVTIDNLPLLTEDVQDYMVLPMDTGTQTFKVTLAQLKEFVGSGVKVGTITEWPSEDTIPSGWYRLNGQELSRSIHTQLFALIGTKHGAGDGSTTFNLENRDGLTPRGIGSQSLNGRLKQGPLEIGDKQEDQIQAHGHNVTTWGLNNNASWSNNGIWMAGQAWNGSSTKNLIIDTNNTLVGRSGSETQTSAFGTIWIIKAADVSFVSATEPIVDILNAEIQALKAKLEKNKSVKCYAAQRTWNLSGAYGEFGAADDGAALASTDNRRRLNYFTTADDDYFEFVNSGLSTNFIRIKKPGKYIIRFTSSMLRTGASTYCYLNVHDVSIPRTQRFDRPANVTLATGAAAAGNGMIGGGSLEVSFSSGTREVSLWHFFATKTAGFNYGRFGIPANTSTDTCSVEIELLEDL